MKNWLYNIGLGSGFIAIVLILSYLGLDFYTHHGNEIKVPNVLNSKPFEAEATLSAADLRMKITDTVYMENKKPGVIVEQLPLANEEVKEERIVYVTVNAISRPRVSMPKLTDCSFNLAKALLKNAGLVLGIVTKEFAEYGNNLVTKQSVAGRSIEAGQKILKGTVIDITIVDTGLDQTSDSTTTNENIDPTDSEN